MVVGRERQAAENPREVSEKVAEGHSKAPDVCPNGLGDTDIHHIGIATLWRNRGRMEDGPDGARNTNAGAYHAPFQPETEGEVPPILPILDGLTYIERQDRLIGLLDDVRKAYESARYMRLQLMVEARANGVSCHDIGVVLGITENAVRAQIRRIRAGA